MLSPFRVFHCGLARADVVSALPVCVFKDLEAPR
jgi:hypothetical protein